MSESAKPRMAVIGLGSMGFGLPAAMGAQAAFPDALVVDIDGAPVAVTTAEATRVTLALPAQLGAGSHTLLVRQAIAFGTESHEPLPKELRPSKLRKSRSPRPLAGA